MPASPPREAFRGGRGRGRPRGNSKLNDAKSDIGGTYSGRRGLPSTTVSSESSTKYKPLPKQAGFRNKSWRNDATSSTKPRIRTNGSNQFVSSKSSKSEEQPWRNPVNETNNAYQKHMSDLYQKLKKDKEKERIDAIKNGILADPDRPTSLANAKTPVGTCQDMCPEFERVERIVQLMVDGAEKTTSEAGTKVPCEENMVKRFRRSAAGYGEQLPSDIRPPLVLQKTLNYLFDEVIGGSQSLGAVHKFVWDRTRGIRNDFSIQQVTKLDDLKIAIDCFERIARFHILALHQLSRRHTDNVEFDHHQEREQLNNTLLSLMYYYDDSRRILTSENEAEFRAYCIIFEIQDQRPDLEDRAQNWPRPLLKDPRVKAAFKLYAAAGNTSDDQGPLRPRTPFSIAQANAGTFWALVQSDHVSYLTACVAEIYFNFVRSTALESIWKAYKGKRGGPTKMEDWILDDMRVALGFDTEEQVQEFCENHGFVILQNTNGEAYVDLGSVTGRFISDSNPRRKQVFSQNLVESKRLGRSLTSIINGINVSGAQSLVGDSSSVENLSRSDEEDSLFINGDSDEDTKTSKVTETSPPKEELQPDNKLNPSANPFRPVAPTFGTPSVTNTNPFANTSSFGKSSSLTSLTPATQNSSILNFGKPSTTTSGLPDQAPPKFNFFSPTNTEVSSNKLSKISPVISTSQPENSLAIQPSSSPSNSVKPLFGVSSSKSNSEKEGIASVPSQASAIAQGNAADGSISKESLSVFPQITFPPAKTSIQPTQFPLNSAAQTAPSPDPLTSASVLKLPETSITTTSKSPFSLFPATTQSTKLNSTPTAPPKAPSFAFTPPSNSDTSIKAPFSTLASPKALNQSNIPSPIISQKSPPIDNLTTKFPSISAKDNFLSSTPAGSPAKPVNVLNQPDLRQKALDSVSKSLMLDKAGLLDQFLEYTLGPIIKTSILQLEDERSWEKARKNRTILLSTKYFEKWRKNAWKLKLLRKGKERRKNLTKSIQDLTRSTREKKDLARINANSFGRSLMPPSLTSPQKRKSLPLDLDQHFPEDLETASGNKRKRQKQLPNGGHVSQKRSKANHMRSKTHGAINSSSVLWNSADVSHSPRLDISHLANDSPRSNSILQKARNLIGKPKLDTTRTDYFLLKSRGIDPDTPIVPLTNRKRSREEAQLANKIPVSKALKPTRESRPSSPITNLKEADPRSDEALFARVRQVREAMAEGISWYRAERVKHRLSAASSKISSPRAETEKEKRLREFQFTPSRTEQRLRKTGANGILSKVWNGMSGIRSASSRREAEEHAMPNFGNDPSVEHVNVEDANLEDTNVDDASAENENGQKIKNEEGRDKENDEEDNLEYDEEDYEGGEGGDEGEGGEEEDDDDDEEDGDEDEDAEWSGQNNRWDESAAPPQFKSDLLSKGGSAEDAIEL